MVYTVTKTKTVNDLKPSQYSCRLIPFERTNGTVSCNVYPRSNSIPYGWILEVPSDIYAAVERRGSVTPKDILEEMKSRK
jgi:hypothetical protein